MTTAETVTAFLSSRFHAALRGGALGPDDRLFSSGIVDSFGVLELIAFSRTRSVSPSTPRATS